MARRKAVTHFVAVSDLSSPAAQQEGILIEVAGRGGDTPTNRAKALEMLQQMWEKGEIAADKFPDGMTTKNIFYVPPESESPPSKPSAKEEFTLPAIVEGAREIIQLTKLQLEVQQVAEEAAPYLPIIQAVWEKTRPLSAKEKELAKDKHYAKTLEKLATIIANQEEYREQSSGKGKLILNALSWQLNQGIKSPARQKRTSRSRKTTKK